MQVVAPVQPASLITPQTNVAIAPKPQLVTSNVAAQAPIMNPVV